MTIAPIPTPAPVHQQVPPARAAASATRSARRAARGPLPLMTGTACTALDLKKDDRHQETRSAATSQR
jgi:hypothetical protein